MIDALIQEKGSGGEILVRNAEVVTVAGFENLPYLCMLGGADWWANTFLDPAERYNCQTEIALRNNPLTSAGRIAIENAIVADLEQISNAIPGTTISVTAVIAAKNRLNVTIVINGNTFYLNWHPDTSFLEYSI